MSYLEQVIWERDLAIEQLKEHGIAFGGIEPDVVKVVRCKDCMFSRMVDEREPKYRCVNICRDGCTQWVGSDDYCSYGEKRR